MFKYFKPNTTSGATSLTKAPVSMDYSVYGLNKRKQSIYQINTLVKQVTTSKNY